jgi:hypothetical protein
VSEPVFEAATYAEAASAMVGIAIDPAHRPGVVQNLELLHRMAQQVMSFPLPEETEPAPVFTP